jgi:hypothetical protein
MISLCITSRIQPFNLFASSLMYDTYDFQHDDEFDSKVALEDRSPVLVVRLRIHPSSSIDNQREEH